MVLPDKLTVKVLPLHIVAVWEGMTGVLLTVTDKLAGTLYPHIFLAYTVKRPPEAVPAVLYEIIFVLSNPTLDQSVLAGDQE